MSSESYQYLGNELDVFKYAVSWKEYWISKIEPYLGDRVLEVGAGIGGTTVQLAHEPRSLWLGLEPDLSMFNYLEQQKDEHGVFPPWCQFFHGTIAELPGDELFDSILYIDVLEHIEQDQKELEVACTYLNDSGYLIVLAPAYQLLFSEFDEAIGHHRRYSRSSLPVLDKENIMQRDVFFLDSLGLFTSLVNKFILHSPQPKLAQIKFWDKWIVPISKFMDPLVQFSFGRSIISVWQKVNS